MSRLTFIRHAETDMLGTFYGHSDPPLNDAGRTRVAVLREALRVHSYDVIYSSDLRRALETATLIAVGCKQPILKRPALREIYFGDWEGRRWSEIEQHDSAYAQRWIHEFPSLAAPNGESFAAFERRVANAVRDLQTNLKGKSAVVVTHAGVMRVVLQNFMGCDQQVAHDMTRAYCCSFEYCGEVLACEATQ